MGISMKKDKIYVIISIAVFMTVLILPSLVWFCVSAVQPDWQQTFDYDLGENRNKAAFPETFSAAYMQEVEEYYNDRLPFRSVMISVDREMNSFMEENYDVFVVPYLAKLVRRDTKLEIKEQTTLQEMAESTIQEEKLEEQEDSDAAVISDGMAQGGGQEALSKTVADKKQEDFMETADQEKEISAKQEQGVLAETEENAGEEAETKETAALENEDAAYLMPKIHNDSVIEGSDKWLFFMLENSLEDYQGSNLFDQAQMEGYVADMQALKQSCDAAGKSLYFLIPPNKEQVYSEKMPDITVYDDYKREQRLVDYIHANTDLKISYPLPEMLAAKENYQVYFRSDTHWNYAGAFVGVQSLYSLMGIPATNLSSVSPTRFDVSAAEIGDLIGLGNLNPAEYGGDVNYAIGYKPDVQANVVAGSDPGANFYSAVCASGQPCNLVVVGDSFRIYAGLFLQKDFSSCTLIKYKYPGDLNNTDAINAIRAADCIVVLLAERDYVFMPGISSEMRSILNGT